MATGKSTTNRINAQFVSTGLIVSTTGTYFGWIWAKQILVTLTIDPGYEVRIGVLQSPHPGSPDCFASARVMTSTGSFSQGVVWVVKQFLGPYTVERVAGELANYHLPLSQFTKPKKRHRWGHSTDCTREDKSKLGSTSTLPVVSVLSWISKPISAVALFRPLCLVCDPFFCLTVKREKARSLLPAGRLTTHRRMPFPGLCFG